MLSEQQQKFIMKIYMNYVTKNVKTLNFDDAKDIYTSRTAFKKAVKYLIDSNLIIVQHLRYNRADYSLTLTGELLARILCNLIDQPDKIRRLKWKLLW